MGFPKMAFLDDFLDDIKSSYNEPVLRAKFEVALVEAARLKLGVSSIYQTEQEWPESLYDIGFDARLKNNYLHSLELHPEGLIVAELIADFGEQKHIKFKPELTVDGELIRWHVTSNVAPNLIEGTPVVSE